jgi:hypothetical protein
VSLRHPPGADLRELPPEILEKIIENHREDFGYPMRCCSCHFGVERGPIWWYKVGSVPAPAPYL